MRQLSVLTGMAVVISVLSGTHAEKQESETNIERPQSRLKIRIGLRRWLSYSPHPNPGLTDSAVGTLGEAELFCKQAHVKGIIPHDDANDCLAQSNNSCPKSVRALPYLVDELPEFHWPQQASSSDCGADSPEFAGNQPGSPKRQAASGRKHDCRPNAPATVAYFGRIGKFCAAGITNNRNRTDFKRFFPGSICKWGELRPLAGEYRYEIYTDIMQIRVVRHHFSTPERLFSA